jgi:hypothetical protein
MIKAVFAALRAKSNPAPLLRMHLKEIYEQLLDNLGQEPYEWQPDRNGARRVNRLECLFVSEFLMEHSIIVKMLEGGDNSKLDTYLNTMRQVLHEFISTLSSGLDYKAALQNRRAAYGQIVSEHPQPECWHLVLAACTGLDHSNNYAALMGSGLLFPALVEHARNAWDMIAGR